MNITSNFYKAAGNLFNKALDAKNPVGKFLTTRLEKGVSDPARFAAAMFVTSIVSKDLVGCVLYTSQSLNNKKIPEDKRKFVAAVDLMNGIVMVGGQFLIGKIIDAKLTPWLTSKFTGSLKDKATGIERFIESDRALHPDNVEKIVRETAKNLNSTEVKEVVTKVLKKCKTPFVNGFGLLVAAIATTALTKRTLAPLISTPMATWFTEATSKKKENPESKMTPAMVDSTMAKTEKGKVLNKVAA